MTQPERLAEKTLALQAKMREAGFLCKCGCGCDYTLPTELARTEGKCFSCRHGAHFGSLPIGGPR